MKIASLCGFVNSIHYNLIIQLFKVSLVSDYLSVDIIIFVSSSPGNPKGTFMYILSDY